MKKSWTDEQLIKAVQNSVNYSEVVRNLSLSQSHGNRNTVIRTIQFLQLDISHFTFKARPRTSDSNFAYRPVTDYLYNNGPRIENIQLKKKLIEANLLPNVCAASSCMIDNVWLGLPISLQLDHINGNRYDNRLENLRFLCPNCHSQTDTWGNKKFKKCLDCLCDIKRSRTRCEVCNKARNKNLPNRQPKINWPSNEELLERLKNSNYSKLGRELGVSDNAIRKRLRNH